MLRRFGPARMALRSHLIALVVVAVMPIIAFSVVMVVLFTRQDRAAVERGARETSRAMSVAVDQQLQGALAALSALALSNALATGNIAGFYDEARALRESEEGWETAFLYDADGTGIFNVRLPLGAPVPSAAQLEPFKRLIETRAPVVSDLTIGRVIRRPVVLVALPVSREGRIRYVVGASIDFQRRVDSLLARQGFPPGWITTVFDRRKIIVARSRGVERLVGTPVTERLAEHSSAAMEGWYRDITLDGIAVYAAFSRSPLSGWTVAIGIPTEPIDASLRRSLLAVVGAGLAFLALAAGLAAVFGRRIAASIGSLSPVARALARADRLPARPASAVTEVEALADDLAAAAEVLNGQARERRRIEHERARLLERTETARAEAELANRTKDEFLATVSHELRTPLTAILGWSRMLHGGRLAPDARARGLEVIERNARLQAQLIEDLLDVSRIISGKLRLEIRPLALVPVVEAALDAVREAAEAKAVVIETALSPAAGAVRGDADRLQQVVWNLLANAIKFTPPGGRVRVSLEASGDEAALVVADTGRGIEPEFLPFVFDRFRQSEPARPSGGLGLGLAIVRHLVELHGGTVTAQSEGRGRGTAFTVRLPLAAASGDAAAAVAERGELARFPSLSGVSMLIVDDDDDTRQLLGIIFEQCDADVRTAASVDEALKLLTDRRADIVVSDINMPQRDGYALVRALRDDEGPDRRTPVVALTASARSEDRDRALAAGFDRHVAKPVEPALLAALVAELVQAGRTAVDGRRV